MIERSHGFAAVLDDELIELERYEFFEPSRYRFEVSRRTFLTVLGGGLLFVGYLPAATAQRGGRGEMPIDARIHFNEDGTITVLTSKVEVGQGARTQLAMAAAEELHVSPDTIRMLMADTDLVPDDGGTYGSLTTPRTVPAVRKAAAAARQALVEYACKEWNVDPEAARVRDGVIQRGSHSISYADLVKKASASELFSESTPTDVDLTEVESWQYLGRDHLKPTSEDVATGAHRYPSDISRPGMLYGCMLRPSSLTSTLKGIEVTEQHRTDGAVIVHDQDFVGCAAPTTHEARRIVAELAKTAQWESAPHPNSEELNDHLRNNTTGGSGRRGPRSREDGDPDGAFNAASNVFEATYSIPYIQHVPMEPRAAVAEWDGEKLTVWTGTQRPNGVRQELARAFSMSGDDVRVIVPDTGGGFGGKHTGDAAVEAARLAKEAGKPVCVQWTRAEEFMWAYFRPAGLMDIRAALEDSGKLIAWEFTNFNSGGSGLETPYAVPNTRHKFQPCESPLREGSYRALASTGNHFARECAMDELAHAAKIDPLEFRLKLLPEGRVRDVLAAAAEKFDWSNAKRDGRGIGIACGTEKSSYCATAAEVSVRPGDGKITVHRLVQTYECGAIQNPVNLRAQVHGCMIQGLGAVFTETIRFRDGKITNGSLKQYEVPRFKDVPPMEIHLLNRPDLDSVGAGETPIITVAPAIANAVFDATGKRLRSLRLSLA